MDKFVEMCQEATHCMRYPQQDSAGWFLWIVWGLIVALIISGFIGSRKIRHHVLAALKNPTEYRGRLDREEFLSVYFGLQALRVCVLVSGFILVAIWGRSIGTVCVILISMALLGWFTAALYSAIVRRGHDFNFEGNEALRAYFLSHFFRRSLLRSQEDIHTWSVLCDQKGNPYANAFGSAPEENNYLIPPEKDWRSENREFPNVWDEADWQSMKRPEPREFKYKRSRWEYPHR